MNDRTLVYTVNEKGETSYLGRIIDEDMGIYKLVVQVDEKGELVYNEHGDTIPAGLAKVTDEYILCHFRKNGKSTRIIKLLPYEEPLDLEDYKIQIHDHKNITKKAIDDIANEPIGKEILAHVNAERGDKKKVYLPDFVNYVNQLREGTPEEQAMFLKYRQYLIDNDVMPVDKDGRAYDLSCMLIPPIEADKFMDHAMLNDFSFATEVSNYLQKNKITELNSSEAIICLNNAKTDSPTLFTRIYEYLVENRFIDRSPILSRLDLTEEQFMFLAHYDKAASDEDLRDAVFPHIKKYLESRLKPGDGIPAVNRLLPQMRYGTLFEQAVYYNFCAMIPDLMKAEELTQSSRQERIKLIMKAKSKARAKSEEKSTASP